MIKKAIAVFLLIAAIYYSFHVLIPNKISNIDTAKNSFSTARALIHLEQISAEQHAIGSKAHDDVRNYIIAQLTDLGLEPQIQEGYSITKWQNLAKSKNILARIKGSEPGKALMLLSHYDSAPHSSFGASDAGSGVATILEGLRAFLSQGETPKNDIIILISDAEEIGLNGADLFVNNHEWAKEVGLVINFEARGSGGPAVMWPETNFGNAKLIDGYAKANPAYPVGYSLIYSIYKLLPNDTDATRFREDGDIESFNFAFIDDHYDYHTSNDNYERLDRNTVEHQGSNLMAMLTHFSNANLNNIRSNDDKVYFNVPIFKFISYPYSWIWPMLLIAVIIFAVLIFLGFKKRRLLKEDVARGFIPLFASIISSLVVGFVLWEIIKLINPHYTEILHGFTYNGYTYIGAFTLVSLGIFSWIYSKFYKPGNTASLLIAPIVLWLILCLLVALYLKGAGFFSIPVYFGLVSLFVLVKQRKPSLILMALLCIPMLMIFSPFLKLFPVALGFFMKIGAISITVKLISMLIVVLCASLMISLFGFFRHKRRWAYVLFLIAFCMLISAQFKSGFNEDRPRPNSLVYVLDIDTNEALWATYDLQLDDWTKQVLGEDPNDNTEIKLNLVGSKYNSGFTFTKKAPLEAFVYPEIEVYKDTIIGENRELSIYIASKRQAQRIELFSDTLNIFNLFEVNDIPVYKSENESTTFSNRKSERLFTYFITDNDPLDMKIVIPKGQRTNFILYEASNDLLENNTFSISERSKAMISKPFVLNDAIILKKTISIN